MQKKKEADLLQCVVEEEKYLAGLRLNGIVPGLHVSGTMEGTRQYKATGHKRLLKDV